MNDWVSRISEEELMSRFVSIFDTPGEDDEVQLSKVMSVLDSIPAIEADFVRLYFFDHVKQTDIATIFGVSQPTVCYRLQRAIDRIRYLLEIPSLDKDSLRESLSRCLKDSVDVDIMVLIFTTTCQSEVAKILGTTQGNVRHRFMRSISKLRNSQDPELVNLGEIFAKVSNNLNILREVRRPIPSARSGFLLEPEPVLKPDLSNSGAIPATQDR